MYSWIIGRGGKKLLPAAFGAVLAISPAFSQIGGTGGSGSGTGTGGSTTSPSTQNNRVCAGTRISNTSGGFVFGTGTSAFSSTGAPIGSTNLTGTTGDTSTGTGTGTGTAAFTGACLAAGTYYFTEDGRDSGDRPYVGFGVLMVDSAGFVTGRETSKSGSRGTQVRTFQGVYRSDSTGNIVLVLNFDTSTRALSIDGLVLATPGAVEAGDTVATLVLSANPNATEFDGIRIDGGNYINVRFNRRAEAQQAFCTVNFPGGTGGTGTGTGGTGTGGTGGTGGSGTGTP